MTHRSALNSACASIALTLAAAAPGRAQMIDHNALEQLFGEPVTTSATGQPQRASEASVNMVIITADDIRRSGAHDLPGVLRHVGGVDVLEWSSGHADIGIRGYNREFASRVLVLIDGRQVYAEHYGFVPWNTLPVQLEAIKQIEVVKGPNAALFGFNAVGGVINIVTYNPLAEDNDQASVSVGSQELVRASAVETLHAGDRFALRISAGVLSADDYSTPIPADLNATGRSRRDERRAVSLDGVAEVSDDVHLWVDASYAESHRNEVAPSVRFTGSEYSVGSVRARLMADTSAGLLEFAAYTSRVTALTDPEFVVGQADFDSRATVISAQDLFTVGAKNTVRLATEYRRTSLGTTSFQGGEVFYDVYSGAGMWDWEISPSVSLTNAIRFDRLELGREGTVPAGYPFTNEDWNRSIRETSFNSGLVWRASDADTLRLMAARGVQLPNLTHLGGFVSTSIVVNVTGSPNLEPSAVTSYEVDWDRAIEAIDGALRAAVFYQETDEVINIEGGLYASPSAVYVGQTNIGDSSAFGFELGLEGVVDDAWRWGFHYRAQDVDDDFTPPFDLIEATSNYEDTTPEHLVQANLGWSRGPWEVDGFVRYQSSVSGIVTDEFAQASLTPIDAYAAFDARVAYEFGGGVTAALSGQNLGLDDQRQTAAPNVERRFMATLTLRR